MPDTQVFDRSSWCTVVATGLVAGLFLLLQVLTITVNRAPAWLELPLVFSEPRSRAETMVARMDGHFTAELAVDPTMGRMKRTFAGDPGDGAMRASRPVTGLLAWALSGGGQRAALAPAILVLTALSAAGAAAAVIGLAASYGARARYPWIALFSPGALVGLVCPGMVDTLAVTLSLGGLAAHRFDRRGWALALWVAAVLTRETAVLVPLAVALVELANRRIRSALLVGGLPLVAYLVWNVVVYLRIGTGVWGGGSNQMGPPLSGLVEGIGHWGGLELVSFAIVAVSIVALWRRGDITIRLIAGLHLLFGSLMGAIVWETWAGFPRVLLAPTFMALAVVFVAGGSGAALQRSDHSDGGLSRAGSAP